MVRSFLPKAALLLVLILLLATPTAQAAEPGARRSPVPSMLPALPDVVAQAWDFLSRVWAHNGCGLDPSGRCQSATATADNGCGIDPDGRCLPGQNATAEADNGCGLDPNGGCGH
jgi:hypothetical protein